MLTKTEQSGSPKHTYADLKKCHAILSNNCEIKLEASYRKITVNYLVSKNEIKYF